ncbi:hypothetical protein M9H77_35400 [Catharanthus roseus]|uniref:Uncharacterized protein n=1 Tax=Catharanthus roseus TaxID=4058 RepID=A0ACB9ZPN0_CATRO|nr:hypothetical protein M9H77_35400 [Catharanthus roseus]
MGYEMGWVKASDSSMIGPFLKISMFLAVIGPFLRASSLVKLTRESSLSAASQYTNSAQSNGNALKSLDYQYPNQTASQHPGKSAEGVSRPQIGENVSPRDKIKFLVSTFLDLKDDKETICSTLDAWVAWEKDFPIGRLKIVLINLEKEQQWHRIMQLIQALDMDHRVKEAHEIWMKKVGSDLHSVPWKLCKLMISVYYRNNMLQELVKLFKSLEAFDRKPREKTIVQIVANANEMLGLVEEKERILKKYQHLFVDTWRVRLKSSGSSGSKKKNTGKETDKESHSPVNHSSVSET